VAILGVDGTYSVRPEKISVAPANATTASANGEVTAKGTVVEVIYAGPSTRFVVDLDAGARLVALQQNVETSSSEANELRNTPVILRWRREHVVAVPGEVDLASSLGDDVTH
jgi:putative spermidine/putrescine transport system ATP-binding protein